jgi:hypothetical protein
MAGLNDTAKNAMLTALGTVIAYASLHTADPGTTGTSEVTGGSPAYARKAITWGTAATHAMAANGTLPVFDVPAGTTVTHLGFWSLASGGTFYGSAQLSSQEVYGGQGTYTVNSSTLTNN